VVLWLAAKLAAAPVAVVGSPLYAVLQAGLRGLAGHSLRAGVFVFVYAWHRIGTFRQCGLEVSSSQPVPAAAPTASLAPAPSAGPAGSEQACLDAFNAALSGACSQSGSSGACCASLAALPGGEQCLTYLADILSADPQYTDLYSAL
jgi:hypothetical protein